MPVNNIQFISENTLKENFVVQQNVDSNLVSPFITVAQELYVEPLLGIALTDELKTQITNNAINGIWEVLLVKYIQPCLVYYTLYEALPFLNIKITNKSLAYKSSENSQPIDFTDLNRFRLMIMETSESYKERLKKYLESKPTPFQSYYTSDISGMQPLNGKETYFSGIQMNSNRNTIYKNKYNC